MPEGYCELTGTLKRSAVEEDEAIGVSGERFTIKELRKGDTLVFKHQEDFFSGEGGALTLNVLRGSRAYIEGTAVGWGTPRWYDIPDAETGTLESLQAVADVPSQGFTVKEDGSGIGYRMGTLDLRDFFVVTESPTGEANVTLDAEALFFALADVGTGWDFSLASNSGHMTGGMF